MTYDLPKIIVKSFYISHKCLLTNSTVEQGFPAGSAVNSPPSNAGDTSSIPGSGRSSGEGNGNPLQFSCLENSTDSRAWWATVRGVTKSGTWLHNQTTTTLLLIESSSFCAHNLSTTHVLLNLHCLCHSLGWALLAFLNFWLSNTTCRILVSWPGTEPSPAAAEARSLNYWTPRGVPLAFLAST